MWYDLHEYAAKICKYIHPYLKILTSNNDILGNYVRIVDYIVYFSMSIMHL